MYLPITQNVIDASPQRIHLLATLLDVLALAQNQSSPQSTAQSNTLDDEWNALSSRQQSEHIHDALCVLLHTMLETASPVIISSQISSQNPSQNISVWSDSDWQEYVMQSHREVITALDAIIAHCQSNPQSNSQSNFRAPQSNCVGFDSRSAMASHGARGLFLLAYQGDPLDPLSSGL